MSSKPKVIIDTDAGVDDAMALLMILDAHRKNHVEIVAITTVHGNTTVENVNINVFRTLDSVKMQQIPVYPGASSGLVSKYVFPGKPYFGLDGFGDVIRDEPPSSLSALKKEHASLALIRLVNENPGEIILLALGPLTNLAISMNISSDWSSLLKDFYVMGGNVAGVGNCSLNAEFNFHCDAEAAKVVLERTKLPIKLTPWETCVHPLKISGEERKSLGSADTPASAFLNLIEGDYVSAIHKSWLTCDQLTAAWFLNEYTQIHKDKFSSLLTAKMESFYATVELSGNHSRGQMIVDHYNRLKKEKNILCMKEVNKDIYMEYLKMAFQ